MKGNTPPTQAEQDGILRSPALAKLCLTRPELFRSLEEAADILSRKAHDYASNEDTYSNFRGCEGQGIPAWRGVLVRIGDKFNRLQEFAKKGELLVTDEGAVDTLLDLANYAHICRHLLSEHLSAKDLDAFADSEVDVDSFYAETGVSSGGIGSQPQGDWLPGPGTRARTFTPGPDFGPGYTEEMVEAQDVSGLNITEAAIQAVREQLASHLSEAGQCSIDKHFARSQVLLWEATKLKHTVPWSDCEAAIEEWKERALLLEAKAERLKSDIAFCRATLTILQMELGALRG